MLKYSQQSEHQRHTELLSVCNLFLLFACQQIVGFLFSCINLLTLLYCIALFGRFSLFYRCARFPQIFFLLKSSLFSNILASKISFCACRVLLLSSIFCLLSSLFSLLSHRSYLFYLLSSLFSIIYLLYSVLSFLKSRFAHYMRAFFASLASTILSLLFSVSSVFSL